MSKISSATKKLSTQKIFLYRAFVSLSFVLLIGVAIYADWQNNIRSQNVERNELAGQLAQLRARIEGVLASNVKTVLGLIAVIESEPNIDGERFRIYAEKLFDDETQLRNIAAAPDMVIRYVYPLEGNEAIIGLDYRQNAAQKQAAEMAKNTGSLVIAGPVQLKQGGQGFIGRIPVFYSTEDGQKKFWGLVSTVINLDEFYRVSGVYDFDARFDLAIRGKDGLGELGEVFWGRADVFASNAIISDVSLPAGTWQIAAIPKGGWAKRADNAVLFRLSLLSIILLIVAPVYWVVHITQKQYEKEILLKGLFDLSPVGVALNDFETGKFIEANDALLASLGYSRTEIVKLSFWDVTPKIYMQDEQKKMHALKTVGKFGPYEKEYLTKEGNRFPVLVNGMKVQSKEGRELIWSVVQDLSERKASEKQIFEANLELQHQMQMLEAITYVQSNFIAQESKGGTLSELVSTIKKLTYSEYVFIHRVILEDDGAVKVVSIASSDEKMNVRLCFIDKKTQALYMHILNSSDAFIWNMFDDDREPRHLPEQWSFVNSLLVHRLTQLENEHFVIMLANRHAGYDASLIHWLSPIMKTSTQLIDSWQNIKAREEMQASLVKAKEIAEDAAKAKSEFLAMMSHEIRTPLNGVIGMLTLLKRTQLDDKQHHKLNIASTSADALLSVINDILDFSKVDAGKLDLEHIKFDLVLLIQEVFEMMELKASEKGLSASLELTQLNWTQVKGDPNRLRQILLNLIGNAIKFTSDGSIRVEASTHDTDQHIELKLSVTDTGIGIPEAKLASLFLPFQQVDASTTRQFGGTGLGLAICYKLCRLMGGGIEVSSQEQVGSCFTIRVPFQKNNAQPEQKPSVSIDKNLTMSPALKMEGAQKILLVEDNRVNQDVATMILEDMQVEADIANNGKEAIEKLKLNTYKLILMDCQMPEMDGYEATRAIRAGLAGDENTSMPIIAMTANAMKGDEEKCLSCGMNDYITKPINEVMLQQKLRRWLQANA